MTSPFQRLAQEQFATEPEQFKKNPYTSPFQQLANSEEFKESTPKSLLRTALQVPIGIAQGSIPGVISNLANLIGTGDALDPEEIEHIRAISEREGIPFDEQAYLNAVENASKYFPTPGNLARIAEENTGIPLTAKNKIQEGLQFASAAATGIPSGQTFRGLNVGLPKPVLGAGVEAAREALISTGVVPEPLADLVSFGILKTPPKGSPSISIGKTEKPSGLPARRFETLTEPRNVSGGKISQINQKLESDFRNISNKIINESPIGETAKNLANDPAFKQDTRELLNQAQSIADKIPGSVPSRSLKTELADLSVKNIKGYALGEYGKSYTKFMKESIGDIIPENIRPGELVEQYRENNRALQEYFEPGSSKALNRAKRDALLDNNRAISNIIEKVDPELSRVFKEGNERWTNIMDSEAIDGFVGEVFKDGMNYKKLHDFFDKTGYDRVFKRALGDKGYKQFETLLKDMLMSEVPYKMLKQAKSKGFEELFKTGGAFILHPTLGKAKLAYDATKESLKFLMNSILDKPQLAIRWKRGVEDLKQGKFAAAEKEFKTLYGEVLAPENTNKAATPKSETTIDITPNQRH